MSKEQNIQLIIAECKRQGLTLDEQTAYVLATVQHETAGTYEPVREAYWKSEDWREANLTRYYPYYGRGFCQVTWHDNYQKYAEILGIDLVGNPDLAMEPATAAFILVHGFRTGAFTGKKITDYIYETDSEIFWDFVNARRCINGLDKADLIAGYAEDWFEKLPGNEDVAENGTTEEPIWLTWARSKLGLKEVPGGADNPEIVKWCKLTSLPPSMYHDSTAWCSIFVNAAFELNGYNGTGSAAAASWLDWGEELEEPQLGCVVVFSRDGGGHVAFYLDEDDDRIKVLGGNQSDAVTEAWYPKNRLRGYRWPT